MRRLRSRARDLGANGGLSRANRRPACRSPRDAIDTSPAQAQHPLLEQCPQLSRDAAPWPRFVQEAVALGPRAQQGLKPIVSAWVAPKGATTPLHHDRHPNYLCHAVGRKLVYLWPPGAPIPRNAPPAENTSPLDAASIVDACELRADLRPGDVLFIPEGWWHYVVTPVTSVSVSVWF